ncbi:TRAP transporter substrate-binding protein [Bacillus swezeyi]|uniref:TRAP transporter substrate-binding protein n=1 Tax=Bacillus swezeyi TaxID=1925020 RepID=A0A1R1QXK9_9BACI|nr:TRAP transporter substrate-binding protein [Bacillus swezeyi]MEC1262981.1 TRAP transporter substrate-binding protein [Bacillus swezeyi]MED2929988.1 TRAP transporter substrate-binding protein [Bacillus swezeyi]MED2944951.1 TRAP transporter substrate-binding protein [Bacillus swezeyi]MED2963121.1 TRAP transporter substrate-binding protein [Bacillus swezeyi]MED2976171.1 TRAP transporter substrate-binding protein [Bacillus swezeyi]
MKRNVILLLVGACILTLITGCSLNAKAGDQVVLRFAYASNAPPVKEAMAEFGRLLEEKTDGEVTVKYYPDSQLGGERELIELTQTGAVDITKVSGSALESFSDRYSIFSIPYLFDGEEHFYNVMENEEIMEPIYQSTSDLGFVGLTYYDSGQRSFYMKDGPLESPEDIKGKKIRVMQSETAIEMIELLGGSPTPMGSGEVYTSLQQGIIDGAENNEFVLVTAGHGEVAKYYSYDQHTRVPDIVVMNEATLNKLTPEQREAVHEAAEESTEYEKKVWKAAVEKEKQLAIEEHGVEFNEVDNTPFKEAVQPLHDEFKNNEEFKDLYEAIQEMSGQ